MFGFSVINFAIRLNDGCGRRKLARRLLVLAAIGKLSCGLYWSQLSDHRFISWLEQCGEGALKITVAERKSMCAQTSWCNALSFEQQIGLLT